MFEYIKGTVEYVYENGIVIDNNGIGYDIKVPTSVTTMYSQIGETAKIYTYLYVREDIVALYGFESKECQEMFKLLITVSGIGPKAAISILSVLSLADLKFAILSDDSKSIAKAQGVGAKTASKLVLELKDKVKLEDAFESKLSSTSTNANNSANNSAVSDATMALVALGYSNSEALKAISKAGNIDDLNTQQIIKLALKNMR